MSNRNLHLVITQISKTPSDYSEFIGTSKRKYTTNRNSDVSEIFFGAHSSMREDENLYLLDAIYKITEKTFIGLSFNSCIHSA